MMTHLTCRYYTYRQHNNKTSEIQMQSGWTK